MEINAAAAKAVPNGGCLRESGGKSEDEAMISLEDCVAMCGLDAAEIAAIAEHEHLPDVAASALASYLLHRTGGEQEIRQMIVDDIREALAANRVDHATKLLMALRHFMDQHPQATCGTAN